MDEQDKKNISANNPDEPKDALGFEAALVGYEKNVLLFRERGRDNSCNDLLEEQDCDIVDWYKQAIVKHLKEDEDFLDKPFGEEWAGPFKFDVIVVDDFLQRIDSPKKFLKKLKELLNPNGYLVCSITNIAHAYNRIKLLNGEFGYTQDGLINENFMRFFTFETILHLLNDSNYSITKLYRETEDLDLIHSKDLKYFTIPDELIESIKNDPESLVSKYVFSIIPTSTDNSEIDYLKEFPKSLTTERLKEFFRYYQGDIAETYDRIIDEKNKVIGELEKSIDESMGTGKKLDKLSPETERYNRERIKVMSETEQYNTDRISIQNDMIKGLEESKRINKIMIKGLEDSKRISKMMIEGLEKSKYENMKMIMGLEESKEKDADMIRGLEESLKETEQYLKKTVEEWKKTVDEIYNSSTWKLASKFTGGQRKRKKN